MQGCGLKTPSRVSTCNYLKPISENLFLENIHDYSDNSQKSDTSIDKSVLIDWT